MVAALKLEMSAALVLDRATGFEVKVRSKEEEQPPPRN
jgi:hypothetical protein